MCLPAADGWGVPWQVVRIRPRAKGCPVMAVRVYLGGCPGGTQRDDLRRRGRVQRHRWRLLAHSASVLGRTEGSGGASRRQVRGVQPVTRTALVSNADAGPAVCRVPPRDRNALPLRRGRPAHPGHQGGTGGKRPRNASRLRAAQQRPVLQRRIRADLGMTAGLAAWWQHNRAAGNEVITVGGQSPSFPSR
jgi:hypothetical protein